MWFTTNAFRSMRHQLFVQKTTVPQVNDFIREGRKILLSHDDIELILCILLRLNLSLSLSPCLFIIVPFVHAPT